LLHGAAPTTIMVLVIDSEVDVRLLIDTVLASGRDVVEHVRSLDPDATRGSTPTRYELSRRSMAAQSRLGQSLQEIQDALAAGDVSAAGPALAYLEADPYYFRSGYARCRLAGRLSRVALAGPELARTRELVLKTVDGQRHCGQPGLGRLAGSVADNALRRALRARLHSPDEAVARRALRTIRYVRRPGLDPQDLQAARALVLRDAGNGRFLTPGIERLARWLWTPEWQSELRQTARHHGPYRTGARRLLENADRRRVRRPGP
jgi:hypothetical protein